MMVSIKEFWKRSIFLTPNSEEVRISQEKLLAEDASAIKDSDSLEELRRIPQATIRPSHCLSIKATILVLGVTFTTLLIAGLSGSSSRKHPELEWIPCGNTPAQARANGCHYEPMQRSWIPDACYFPEPSNEYHPFDDREWFLDDRLTIPLNDSNGLQKLRDGEEMVGYTATFHDEHCLYCWRKLAIAVENRLPLIDSKSASFHHSTHCAQLISGFIHEVAAERFDIHDTYTFSPLMFQTCVSLEWK
jgi:hypothetical protein